MKIIITESASVTSLIARSLSIKTFRDSTDSSDSDIAVITVEPDFIAPCPVGVMPGKDALPLVPERYICAIRHTEDPNGKWETAPEDTAFADWLSDLLRHADEVIFASDGGADAQSRFTGICRYFRVGCRTSRMFLTRLERKAVREAFKKRERGVSLHNLAQTGFVQSAMEELFRYNITEAYRAPLSGLSMEIGRQDYVALRTAKEMLDTFEKTGKDLVRQTWYGCCVTGYVEGQDIRFFPGNLHTSKEECLAEYDALPVTGSVSAVYTDIDREVEEVTELYTLATLQFEAREKLGFSFRKSRDIAVSLFGMGYISTPLTACPLLPMSMFGYIKGRFPKAAKFIFLPDEAMPRTHGIITTGTRPYALDADAQALYDLISGRMTKAVHAPAVKTSLVIGINIGEQAYYGTMPWKEGEGVPEALEVELMGKSYYPTMTPEPQPMRMTHLLAAVMTLSGRLMKKEVLGYDFNPCLHDYTEALERLSVNGLILDVCGEPALTEKGRFFLDTMERYYSVPQVLADIAESGRIAVSEKRKGGAALMEEYGERVYHAVTGLVSDSDMYLPKSGLYACPLCGRHSVIGYDRALRCHVCGFSIPRQFKGHRLTDSEVSSLLTHGYTSPNLMFVNRRGHEYAEALAIGRKGGLAFVPSEAKIY